MNLRSITIDVNSFQNSNFESVNRDLWLTHLTAIKDVTVDNPPVPAQIIQRYLFDWFINWQQLTGVCLPPREHANKFDITASAQNWINFYQNSGFRVYITAIYRHTDTIEKDYFNILN